MSNELDRKQFEQQHDDLLNTMSLDELYWLNEMVIDRMKLMEKLNDLAATSAFRRGQKVNWNHEGNLYTGWVARVNQRTISVTEINEPYRKWKITPEFLTKV